ncbi:MAG TPA: integrin alpha [Candidatus Polarisedimenticolia bacterium]|nr:integrin alpha [Candidatus Polarisedimenticolia bacterium]
MLRRRLARLAPRRRLSRFPFAILVAIALCAGPGVGVASAITSRVVIDPTGEHTGDEFGRSIAWVGDANGDGYDDVLVGAFRYPEIASVGQAYLYLGGPTMDAVADLVITPPSGGTGWFGVSVASAGDFNGDGHADFIIGAQQAGAEGRAFIYYGGPALDGTPDVTLIGETTGAITAFGASVAAAGDMNEDGFGDVIVGAPWYPGGNNKPGRAYLYFGGAAPDALADRVFTGVGFFDQLGSAVGSAGDMNGDGHPDLFASAPNNTAAALGAGVISVWFGGPGSDATADLNLPGFGVNERLLNAANAGDVNDDGFSDLIGAGKDHVSVWFGGSTPNAVADLTLARTYASVACAGDVDGDGIDDFVVGAQYDASGGSGRASIYFGGSGVDTVDDLHYDGVPGGGAIGLSVAGGGHVDGPGPADVIASAFFDPEAIGYNMGHVFVMANSGACDGSAPLPGAVNGSVRLAGDGSGATITWSDAPGPFNVYRGSRTSGSPWNYNQTCHDSHVAASNTTDSENPLLGTVFFYLVTRVGACGESIPGQDSGGQSNPNPAPCP